MNKNLFKKNHKHELAKLRKEVKELRYAEKINQISFEISSAVNTTADLKDLYKSIHESLKKLIFLPNFYISIVDREKQLLYFPYCEDECDGNGELEPRSFKIGSLTKDVIVNKLPLFLGRKEITERFKNNAAAGTLCEAWIGAPLIVDNEAIGAMVMQSYDNPEIFSKRDLEFFISISNQVAMAIDRKYAIDQLEKNEETFRALVQNSDDIVMRFDRHYRYLYVNPAIKILDLIPEEMIGKTHGEIGFPSEFYEQWEKKIEQVFITKKSCRAEVYTPGGFWFDWLLRPEFSFNGEVAAVMTSARDITERKRLDAQRASLNSINQIIINAENIQEMLDNALIEVQKIFITDRAWIGQFNSITNHFNLLSEYTLPEWPGAMAEEQQINMGKDAIDRLIRVAEDRGLIVFDQKAMDNLREDIIREYKIKSMMIMPVHSEDDITWLFGIQQCSQEHAWTPAEQDFFKEMGRKITNGLNNMLLHRKLKDAKNYIDNIIDSMPSILIGVNAELNITRMNPRAETYAGRRYSESKGEKLQSVFPFLQPYIEKIIQAMEDRKASGETKIPRHINGKLCYENLTIYPLVDGAIQGAVVRIDDVTEQVKIEELMVHSEKMLSVGGLAAGMAHEINNPLAGMMQNAQVINNRLLKDLPANNMAAQKAGITIESLKDYLVQRNIPNMLENINKAGRNAAQIVRNMLAFVREKTGAKTLNNMADLVDATIELAHHDYDLKKKYNFKNILITRDYDPDLPEVLCESNMIQQVVFNILKNGAEAIFERFHQAACQTDDSVDLPEPEFCIRLVKKQDSIIIEIKDNGIGMDDNTAKHVFDPFFTTKDPDKGTGLGLSVSYFIIVENHKGEISVEPMPDHGSVVTIKLPINNHA